MVSFLLLFVLGTAVSASCEPIEVGYLWSEHNAIKYNWLRQDMAIETLELFGIECHKLSDKEACDPGILSKYRVITASTVYTLPEDVVRALIQYVKDGGRLVFGDAPVLVQNSDFANVFGFTSSENKCWYLKNAKFIPTVENKLNLEEFSVAEGLTNAFVSELLDTAQVWLYIKGPMAPPRSSDHQEVNLPGIIVNSYGKGSGFLLNWSIFATGDISTQALYPMTILWATEK